MVRINGLQIISLELEARVSCPSCRFKYLFVRDNVPVLLAPVPKVCMYSLLV